MTTAQQCTRNNLDGSRCKKMTLKKNLDCGSHHCKSQLSANIVERVGESLDDDLDDTTDGDYDLSTQVGHVLYHFAKLQKHGSVLDEMMIEEVAEYVEYLQMGLHYDDADRWLNKAASILHGSPTVRAWRALHELAESYDIPIQVDNVSWDERYED